MCCGHLLTTRYKFLRIYVFRNGSRVLMVKHGVLMLFSEWSSLNFQDNIRDICASFLEWIPAFEQYHGQVTVGYLSFAWLNKDLETGYKIWGSVLASHLNWKIPGLEEFPSFCMLCYISAYQYLRVSDSRFGLNSVLGFSNELEIQAWCQKFCYSQQEAKTLDQRLSLELLEGDLSSRLGFPQPPSFWVTLSLLDFDSSV